MLSYYDGRTGRGGVRRNGLQKSDAFCKPRRPHRLNHPTLRINLCEKKEEHAVEFAALAHTFEELEGTSSRLALIELLTQLFHSIQRPEEIEQVCYLVQGRVVPFFLALEMGMAEKSVTKSIAVAYHTTPEHVAALYATLGDLGLVAAQVNCEAGIVP